MSKPVINFSCSKNIQGAGDSARLMVRRNNVIEVLTTREGVKGWATESSTTYPSNAAARRVMGSTK